MKCQKKFCLKCGRGWNYDWVICPWCYDKAKVNRLSSVNCLSSGGVFFELPEHIVFEDLDK